MLKDQELVWRRRAQLDYPMPTEQAIRDVLARAVADGSPTTTVRGVVQLFERWAGVTVAG